LLVWCIVGYIRMPQQREHAMAYFQRRMDGIERGGKIAADVFCVLLLGVMALGCLGIFPGIVASVLVVLGVLVIDYFTTDPDDHLAGVIR
jgi:hypothetical protein